MHCERKFKFRSHNASYYLIEVVTKVGLTSSKQIILGTKSLKQEVEAIVKSVV